MRNKFLFDLAPINTGFAPNGIYDERILNFHNLRSGNFISSSYVGNVATSKSSVTNFSTAFFCQENIRTFIKLAKLISANGSVPAIQIGSRISARKPPKKWTGNILSHVAFASAELVRLSSYEIQKEIDLLVDIALKLADCGFLVVQLHAAHGYFFSRLFNRIINTRTDKFAFGELDWLLNSLAKFGLASSSLLEIRLNIKDGIEEIDHELIYKKKLIGAIADIGFKRISLSNGFYDIDKNFIYPATKSFSDASISFATEIAKEHKQCTFSVAGNILGSVTPNSNIPENLVIALGRPLIADPFAVTNFWNNRSLICNFCGECHYFSKGRSSLTCPRPTSNL